ncbi:MAG: hypothetical protein A2788_02530 [Candidatus Abawacabacteria bacterium RIFCSPHIGHO2_01_FULL_46_8]|uniref:Type II secretion system protein J n=1 Tax=Candidatus Abawacabacteria bacterium RIFCSPHIGHO2_01_FULL_46_8 TaxID=1817815 RepID=A0A1F4XNW6_9BACT|nr:MAG: hypothetical protein A2788_02530 [Candidatus Abawacabacteria bacterium RIFCSPHIGHO2_01_FULL_46_8]
MSSTQFHHQRGVSLIETLVALFILALGITAALSLLGYVSGITAGTKNRIIATNLAREGIEAVRNIRDSNWLFYGEGGARDHWNDGWEGDENPGAKREYKLVLQADLNQQFSYRLVEILLPAPNPPLPDEEARVYLRSGIVGLPETAPVYTQAEGEGEPSIYSRRLIISYPTETDAGGAGNNIVNVDSIVTWYERGIAKKIELSTKLSDWWQRSDHS